MKITRIDLAGQGAWPDFSTDHLDAGLNLFYAAAKGGKTTLAGLVGQLIYGKSPAVVRPHFIDLSHVPDGTLQLADKHGQYTLGRSKSQDGEIRLSFASQDGKDDAKAWFRANLGELRAEQAADLMAVDFEIAPQPQQLLREPFIGFLQDKLSGQGSALTSTEPLDKQRIEELMRRRNDVAKRLEERMHAGQRNSHVLEDEAQQIDNQLKQKRMQREDLQRELQDLDAELREHDAYLRYLSLEANAHTITGPDRAKLEAKLAALDKQIADCRGMLSAMQERATIVQTELAQSANDGSASRVTALADSRITIKVLENLLDDLDAEVAQLARTDQSHRPVTSDTHARFTPLADLLRQQVYTLCGQVAEQQRAVTRGQLKAESRQLNRAQLEMGDRLEQLLQQRESLVQESQRYDTARGISLGAPAKDLCRCDGHTEFKSLFEQFGLTLTAAEAKDRRTQLDQERYRLRNEISALGRDIAQLESAWKQVQQERAGLVEGPAIAESKAELDRLDSLLRQSLADRSSAAEAWNVNRWRVSDLLAQFSGGQLREVRVTHDEQLLRITDKDRKVYSVGFLKPAERDQLYLALTLSLVNDLASRGIHLPLLLDEPFLRQDEESTAVMAGVLEQFGRAGHQLLVFTEDRRALQTCQSLSACVFQLGEQPKVAAPTVRTEKVTTTKLVRETLDGDASPGLRIASGHGDGDIEAVYYLSKQSSLSEFPVLGSGTAATFSKLGIQSVGDLLDADAEWIARELGKSNITGDTVALWKSHMLLLCEVPELTLNDAQLLTAVGIMSPHQLRHAKTSELWNSLTHLFDSDAGSRFRSARSRYTRHRIDDWIYAAGGAREKRSDRSNSAKSSRSSGSGRSSRTNGSASRSRSESRSSGSRRSSRTRRGENRKRSAATSHGSSSAQTSRRAPRFNLSMTSDVEAAPSIGPKTAERLYKVGVHTVSDLLNADVESLAEKIDAKHIRATTITTWQDQARLVCQIPDLQGYGAMLLVGCELSKPESVAAMDSATLIAQVQEFCRSKKGQRLLRSAEPPTAERIMRWIELAKQSRSLQVA